MKKTNYKDLLIHSLELRLFLIELESMLEKFNIFTRKKQAKTSPEDHTSDEVL